MLYLYLSWLSLFRLYSDLYFWRYSHLYLRFTKYFIIPFEEDIIHLRNRRLLLKMWACLHFSFSLSSIRLWSLKMSCILSCYLWWIMSHHGYRYSREQGSWSCFWWRRNQSDGVPYLFWTHACWYSWQRQWSSLWDNALYFGMRKFMPDKLREVLFLFLIEWRKHLRLCELRIRDSL